MDSTSDRACREGAEQRLWGQASLDAHGTFCGPGSSGPERCKKRGLAGPPHGSGRPGVPLGKFWARGARAEGRGPSADHQLPPDNGRTVGYATSIGKRQLTISHRRPTAAHVMSGGSIRTERKH